MFGFKNNATELINLQNELKRLRRKKEDLKNEIRIVKQKIENLGGPVHHEYDE